MINGCVGELMPEAYNIDNEDTDMNFDLESVTEAEGLRYIGGYIARKFPQYQLGFKFQKGEEATWLDEISRQNQKLFKPSSEFYKHLQVMGGLFNSFHGEKGLKPGKGAVTTLSSLMKEHISLPYEVITFYVRCRTFFRIRILNRANRNERMLQKKMHKIVN